MKSFSTLLLSLLLLGGSIQAQDGQKPAFREAGETMISLQGLRLYSTRELNTPYPILPANNLQISIAKFHKPQKMRGLKIGYGSYLGDAAVIPRVEGTTLSAVAFMRGYRGTKRLSVFSETSIGTDRQFVSSTNNLPEGNRIWWDVYLQSSFGLDARIGKRLGVEGSIGVRAGTDNYFTNDELAFKFRVVSNVGINYFFNRN
ncbi:MAG: hypothetical protein AAFQ68_18505 [Bacteroidota bacterium]